MTSIKAFSGYLVKNEHAADVVAPEYDTVPAATRRAFADANPQNFLNTIRLKEDFDPTAPPSHEQLIQFNRNNLHRLLSENYFKKLEQPAIFIYELIHGEHGQTGIVCEIPAEEYATGHIKKHENTRRDREDLLAQYQKSIGATSCPISLAYPQNKAIDAFIKQQTKAKPILDFTTGDNVHQRVWCIMDTQDHQHLATLFNQVEATYLTDGHHRAASGWRYAEMMRQTNGNIGEEPYNHLLVALFSDHELNLLPFHRVVSDLGNKTEAEILNDLNYAFDLTIAHDQANYEPTKHGEFGMLLGKKWYQLNTKSEFINQDDPVESLDVTLLQQHILGPILNIQDYRTDPRLDYVPGNEGKQGLEQKHKEGYAICFNCYATSMEQLMDVADASALMPPKSTYFDPKTRSGVFVRLT